MIVACPNCCAKLQNNEAVADQVVNCPNCSRQLRMPALVVAGGDERPSPIYFPEIFEVQSVEQAMAVIVTPETGITTEERWERETAYLIGDIGTFLAIGPHSCVLDYGCGIGRIAKPLIETFGCRVVGVDTSQSMRQLAPQYVQSDRFVAWSPEVFDDMIRQGFQADFGVCLWVLQHVMDARGVIKRIAGALRPEGLLYAMNQLRRCVPTDQGWCDDGDDVPAALRSVFSEENVHPLPAEAITADLGSRTRIQVLRKRATAS